MTCQLGTSAGQRIALAQSKLRILQSIARKKMVEASGIIKWAKIPKSLPTPFFYVAGVPFLLPQFLLFGPSITRTLTDSNSKSNPNFDIPGFPTEAWGNSEIAYYMYLTSTVAWYPCSHDTREYKQIKVKRQEKSIRSHIHGDSFILFILY